MSMSEKRLYQNSSLRADRRKSSTYLDGCATITREIGLIFTISRMSDENLRVPKVRLNAVNAMRTGKFDVTQMTVVGRRID